MSQSPIKFFSEITAADRATVGGKGANLAALRAAKFSVPDGFCITVAAVNPHREISSELDDALQVAFHQLNAHAVAVRSSALAEDSAETSFAGAHETILNVRDLDALRKAIIECWHSADTARAKTYRREHDLDDSAAMMGVVVQTMVDAECAGVCFTVNPHDASDDRIFIEAARGLGDRVVSGEVMPDLFIVERNGEKIDQRPNNASALNDAQVRAIADLGLRVEQHFGAPQDIEWAARNGTIYLLQSRPITTASGKAETREMEAVRQREIAALRASAAPEGTIWSNYNLAEVLPAPLPLTASMMRIFMSADGTLGRALAGLGLMPGGLARKGVVQIICGRTYFNMSREVHLYFSGFPFEHNFAELKANPSKASYHHPTIAKKIPPSFLFKLPWYAVKMTVAALKLSRTQKRLADDIEKRVIPAFLAEIARERTVDLRPLNAQQLFERSNQLSEKISGYVSELLKPTAVAALATSEAERELTKILGEGEAKQWIQRVVQGRTASSTVGENQALWEVAHGKRTLEKFLEDYGHRCVGELEMARPRWREDPQFVLRMVEQMRAQGGAGPQEKFETQVDAHSHDREALEKLLDQKAPHRKTAVMKQVNLARRFFPYRETSKHYWMMGAELMRKTLLALDARLGLNGDIFWLTLEELPLALEGKPIAGKSLHEVIAERKRARELAMKIPLPEVIFSDDLEAIGRPPKPPEGKEFFGLGVSAGVARGRAVVVCDPSEAPPMGDDAILVCRSTDPGWTPLFVQAKGLVLERGGLLSHGAVVAREFGLPAVAGIEQATQFLRTGQRLFVDGNNGKVILETE